MPSGRLLKGSVGNLTRLSLRCISIGSGGPQRGRPPHDRGKRLAARPKRHPRQAYDLRLAGPRRDAVRRTTGVTVAGNVTRGVCDDGHAPDGTGHSGRRSRGDCRLRQSRPTYSERRTARHIAVSDRRRSGRSVSTPSAQIPLTRVASLVPRADHGYPGELDVVRVGVSAKPPRRCAATHSAAR